MGSLGSLLTPNVRARFAVLFTAFIGAFFGYLQTELEAGIPPENQWKHIVAVAAITGIAAAYHRWKPTPAAVAAAARGIGAGPAVLALMSAALALSMTACGLFGGVIAPTVTLGACLAQVAQTPHASFQEYFAAAWASCKDDAGQDAVAILDAIIASADPKVQAYVTEAKIAKSDTGARAALVSYARAKADR